MGDVVTTSMDGVDGGNVMTTSMDGVDYGNVMTTSMVGWNVIEGQEMEGFVKCHKDNNGE